MYRYRVSGLIPKYWEACRTFITSRDSLTRNVHPVSITPQELACATPSSGRNNNPQGAACVNFMSLRPTVRQAFLACNCPSNAVNPRQFTWYCRQVLQNIGLHSYQYHNRLYFFPLSTLSRRTVILCMQSTGKRWVSKAFRGLLTVAAACTKNRAPVPGLRAYISWPQAGIGEVHRLHTWKMQEPLKLTRGCTAWHSSFPQTERRSGLFSSNRLLRAFRPLSPLPSKHYAGFVRIFTVARLPFISGLRSDAPHSKRPTS